MSRPPLSGPFDIAPEGIALVDQGEREADDEQNDGDGAAIAEGDAPETAVDEIGRHGRRGPGRTALGHDPDQIEQLQGTDDGQKDPDADRRGEQGKGDVTGHLPCVGAIDLRRLADVFGRALQTRQEQDDTETDIFPGGDAENRPHDDISVGQPQLHEIAEADGFQQIVEGAAGLQEHRPDHRRDRLGKHIGREHEKPEGGSADDLPLSSSAIAMLRGSCTTSEKVTMKMLLVTPLKKPDRPKDLDVVAQADEIVERGEAVPLEKAVIGRGDQGDEDEGDEQDERGPDEHE